MTNSSVPSQHRNSRRGGRLTYANERIGEISTDSAPITNRLKLTARGKRLIIASAITAGVVPGMLSGFGQNSEAHTNVHATEDNKGGGTPNTEPYVVKSGDSAWKIAREHLGVEAEIRPLVSDIEGQANADKRPGLHPGDTILLPPRE